ncbi:hypothetical protein ACPXCX_57785, partial [Streptomyces sp. DT225]
QQLSPYQNSNRIPLTIVDALLPDLDDPAAVTGWSMPSPGAIARGAAGLVGAVGYAMQPQLQASLRPAAERYLNGHRDSVR